MSALRPRGYHFATRAQWDACLRSGADPRLGTIGPHAALVDPAKPSFASDGAFAPAWTRTREILWRDQDGTLYRLASGDEEPIAVAAPSAVATASRIIATGTGLWARGGAAGAVACFDPSSLSRRFVVEIRGARVLDIAGGRRDGIMALVERDRRWEVVPIDCSGRTGEPILIEGITELRELVHARGDTPIVVLSRDGRTIFGFSEKGGVPAIRLVSATLGNCFVARHIAADRSGRVFVAGRDDRPLRAHVAILDGLGARIGDVGLPEPATGLAAASDGLLVTGEHGLYRLTASNPAPASAPEVGTLIVTPMLEAPATEDGRRWLRIEAEASLPEGASIEIAYAAPDDPAVREDLLRLAGDSSMPAARRAELLRSAGGVWSIPVRFHGRDASPGGDDATFAVPLHDVRGRSVWVAVSLAASGGAKLPFLTRLSVLYPGSTLMEHLPAIYQREEAQPGSFARALVGVLETTTQDLDARIADLGRNLQPDPASEPWLDYVARWLGLPWDDALSRAQKVCIVKNAPRLAGARGTRAGLEALLDCLVPGKPRRFRILDATVDYGLAWLGGGACRGSALPAILGGLPATAAFLGVQATLDSMRLPCPGDTRDDASSRFLGEIRVDVAANAAEREAWEPWLTRLVAEMIPVSARARVRWTSASGLRGDRLDESLELEGEHPPRLGTDAITGEARFPRASAATLPASTGGEGPILG